MSAGRNLITLFSSVNNLSRSFFPWRARTLRTSPCSHRVRACHPRARCNDTHQVDATHASNGAACSDSHDSHAESRTSSRYSPGARVRRSSTGRVPLRFDAGFRVAQVRLRENCANFPRPSAARAALAARIAQVFALCRMTTKASRKMRRQPVGGQEKTRGVSAAGFRVRAGRAISALRFPAAPRTRPDPAAR